MNKKDTLEFLLKKMKEVSDEKLNDTFASALQLSFEQKGTLNFVFWLCYMAETDLNTSLAEAWKISGSFFSAEARNIAEKTIADNLKNYGEKNANIDLLMKELGIELDKQGKILEFINKNYSLRRVFPGVENLEYFLDKIRVYELFSGKTKRVKMLYKINEIRNDLSHNRIDKLNYEGNSLSLRTTKEALLKDYWECVFNNDEATPKIDFEKPTPEQKAQIEEIIKYYPL